MTTRSQASACVAGGGEVVGDDDALARGEAVVLDDVRSAEGVEGLVDLLGGGADVAAGGGDAGRRPSRPWRRPWSPPAAAASPEGPKHGDARGAHGVGDPGDERRLRADDDQLGAQLGGERGDGGAVEGVDRVQLGHLGDAGVAGRAVQSGDVGVEGQRAAQGVFAGAAADDEDLHGVSLAAGGGGPGRLPVRGRPVPVRSGRRLLAGLATRW